MANSGFCIGQRAGQRVTTLIDYVIRPIVTEDQTVLCDLLYEALFVPPGQAAFPPEIVHGRELARYAENWGGEKDLGLIAVTPDGHPIGAAWLRLLAGEDKGYGWGDDETPEFSVALFPAYRGMGIGTELLTRLPEEAAHRFAAVSLCADRRNLAVKLYERLGFEVVSLSEDSVVMRLELGPVSS